MLAIQNSFSSFWQNFVGVLGTIKFKDILDILAVALIIYYAISMVRETRAMQLVKSIGVIVGIYFVTSYFELNTLTFFLGKVVEWGLIVLVILFQPEIRRVLEHIGRGKLMDLFSIGSITQVQAEGTGEMIEVICNAAETLAQSKTGALIVLERQIRLGDIINTGTEIDAKASTELICNVFYPKSPLHDGAMIVRNSRVYAAGCFLPLSSNNEIGRELGTRHRAALGMSEVSDAVIVIVSEETGAISVAYESRLHRGLSITNLKRLLSSKMLGESDGSPKDKQKLPFWKVVKK